MGEKITGIYAYGDLSYGLTDGHGWLNKGVYRTEIPSFNETDAASNLAMTLTFLISVLAMALFF